MKRLAVFAFLLSSLAHAGTTTFVSVGTSATKMPSTRILLRSALLVENNSASDIWCSYAALGASDGSTPTVAVGRGHKISAGGWRSFPGDILWCVSAVAQTGTGADVTAVSEISGDT